MRRLTVGETIATGLPRSALVVRVLGSTYIFRPTQPSSYAGNRAVSYAIVEDTGPYVALEEYWKEHAP